MTELAQLHATLCAARHASMPLRDADLDRLITLAETAKARYRRMELALDEIVLDAREDARIKADALERGVVVRFGGGL